MGRVNFGAREVEIEGKNRHIPEIIIETGGPDPVQVVFTSNLILETEAEAETFCRHLYKILTGPKHPSQVTNYPGGTSGHLN